jgi:drug/metabolite transporter (DMT)-like permease
MDWFSLAFISALFSAVAAVSQKKILFKLSALDFSLLLSIFSFIFSIPFFIGINFASLNTTSLLILLCKNILGAFAFLYVMLSIKNLEISQALPLLALTPGFVAIFAFITIGDSLSLDEVLGIVLLLIGTYILESKANQSVLEPFKVFYKSKKYRYVIVALILLTTTSILDRFLLNKSQNVIGPVAFMAFQQLFLGVIFLIIYFFSSHSFKKLSASVDKNILFWVIIIALLTIGYRYTQIEATKLAPAAMVLAVKRISVFFAAIIGGKIFKEQRLLVKAAATAIIIAGVFLISAV